MTRLALTLGLALSVSGAATPLADPPAAPCVTSHGEARLRYPGYDHVVVLTNACDPAYRCTVTTNVNPDAMVADVPGHREVEVLTFRGSPASEFTHKAECRKID
jgi:hypothetical protein